MTSTVLEAFGVAAREEKIWTHTRWTLYQLLSDFIIYKPSVHLIVKWRNKLNRTEWDNAAFVQFRTLISEPEASSLAQFCKLQTQEYDRLIGQHSLRESFYASTESQHSAVSASVEYDQAGVILNRTSDEKNDELSMELEFMAVLSERLTEQGVRSQVECEQLAITQWRFLKQHLLMWVPAFCEEVRNQTASPLYAALSDLMDELLTADYRWLDTQVHS
ncbi:molecular chaperone [Saccharibacillus sp. JS10]|uniref:TorD/DmsD family molecular chaperone n=1 Tax=Saccharibacillus sp. JS10 TaxID=2950552 RepID=UPI00210A8A2A|nr:molecular chaperone TorD family protein [Saccharibacillus sp. JS10]MCQ4088093.1 molecular chaperone TorD family protein [Saccharibacillus sp. JS10]